MAVHIGQQTQAMDSRAAPHTRQKRAFEFACCTGTGATTLVDPVDAPCRSDTDEPISENPASTTCRHRAAVGASYKLSMVATLVLQIAPTTADELLKSFRIVTAVRFSECVPILVRSKPVKKSVPLHAYRHGLSAERGRRDLRCAPGSLPR